MTLATAAVAPVRGAGLRQDEEIQSRLRKATGQLSGVSRMVRDGRYCIGVLDQLSAVTAAIEAVAVLVLSDHVHACLREAIVSGDTDAKVTELVTAVRRFVRS